MPSRVRDCTKKTRIATDIAPDCNEYQAVCALWAHRSLDVRVPITTSMDARKMYKTHIPHAFVLLQADAEPDLKTSCAQRGALSHEASNLKLESQILT